MNSEIFHRTIEKVYSEQEFQQLLVSGKKLRIKYGVDVTAPFLHLGHAVNLWMMRWLQEQGHKVVFLIGDFTTRIGDPTGKSKTRKVISPQDIETNAQEFIRQVSAVLLTGPQVFEVRRNSEWYDQMSLGDFFQLLGRTTHGKLVQRDMFQKRIANGDAIHMHEFLYPVLQGWDSVELESDLTIVGNDQLFNEMMGRTFQTQQGQKPQVIITTKITPGTDGKEKQSKSLGNYIALADTPRDKFGKIMSIPDSLIPLYFQVYTTASSFPARTTDKPMEDKKRLACWVVARYHGWTKAVEEKAWFETAFSKKKQPDNLPLVHIEPTMSIMSVLRLCLPGHSNSHYHRLVKQGAVKVDGSTISPNNLHQTWAFGVLDNVVKIGKKNWFRVVG